MIHVLLAKDLRRACRNPLPWLINLAIPLVIVALVGLTFGGSTRQNQGLGRIRFGIVDEDGSRLVQLLRGALTQSTGAQYLEPVFLDRAPALVELEKNRLSAVVVLPKEFTHDYLAGRPTRLELIKSPAQSINPAVLEEGLGVLVSALDALGRNFSSDLATWQDVIVGRQDYERVAEMIKATGDKVKSLGAYLNPPLISYVMTEDPAQPNSGDRGAGFNLFGFLLIGMAGMFLLFLAGIGISDLHREVQLRTLDRFRTMHDSLVAFIGAKVLFSTVMLLGCAAILFAGGALSFGFSWPRVAPLIVLILGYVVFASGLMALLVALTPDQRKADALRNLVGMGLGIAGGCAFPPEVFPPFLRQQVMPFLPTHWFVSAARSIEFGGAEISWSLAASKLAIAGIASLALSAWFFRRQLMKGTGA